MSSRRPIGQVYTGIISQVSVSAAQDVFELTCPSTTRVRIREVKLGQYSDAGDATAEILSVQLIIGHTTSGSGGAAVTPRNLNRASTVTAASTLERNNTTIAANGTAITLYSDVWNIQSGWWYAPSEFEMITIDISTRLVVRITSPVDAITLNATIVFEELGTLAG